MPVLPAPDDAAPLEPAACRCATAAQRICAQAPHRASGWRWMRQIWGFFGRHRALVFVLLLSILQQSAHAELWAYVDERGVTHFAAEQRDSRYQLFFQGEVFDSTRDGSVSAGLASGAGTGLQARRTQLLTRLTLSADHAPVQRHLRAASSRHGVDYELLQALVAAESGFDAAAVSPKGAVGLMQVMPATAARFGVTGDARRPIEQKLADPAVNVPLGTRYLRYLIDLFPQRLDLALAAYNAGEGAVLRAGHQIPPYPETRNYVQTVLALYAQLKPTAPVRAQRPSGGRVRMEWPGGAQGRGNLPAAVGTAARPALIEPALTE